MSDTTSSLTADTQALLDRVSTTNARVNDVNRDIERKRSQADFQKNQLLSALRDHDSKFSTNFSELFESDPEKFSAELAQVMGKLSSQLAEDNARNEKILALYEQGDYAQIRSLQGIEPETPAPSTPPAQSTAKPQQTQPAPAQPTVAPTAPPSAVATSVSPSSAITLPASPTAQPTAQAPAQPTQAPAPAPAQPTAQSAPTAPPSAPVVAPGVSTPGAVPPSPARFSMPAQAFDAQVVEDVDPESDGTPAPAPAPPAPAQPAPAPTAQPAPTSAPAQAPAPAFGFGMSFAPAVQANQQVAEESLATNPFVKKS